MTQQFHIYESQLTKVNKCNRLGIQQSLVIRKVWIITNVQEEASWHWTKGYQVLTKSMAPLILMWLWSPGGLLTVQILWWISGKLPCNSEDTGSQVTLEIPRLKYFLLKQYLKQESKELTTSAPIHTPPHQRQQRSNSKHIFWWSHHLLQNPPQQNVPSFRYKLLSSICIIWKC